MSYANSLWNPSNWFNGSKFYRLKAKYEKEYFNNARAVIAEYNLVVRDLYDSTITRTLTPDEQYKYNEAISQNRLDIVKSQLEKDFLKGTVGEVKWHDENPQNVSVRIHRKGLKSFTDILANYNATIETGYMWHLVGEEIFIQIMVSVLVTFAVYLVALAMSALPWGWAQYIASFYKYYNTAISTISFMVSMITQALLFYESVRTMKLEAQKISFQSATNYNAASNDLREHKKYAGTHSKIHNAYRIYANGDIFTSQSAGSETFTPTRAFNPTEHFRTQKPEIYTSLPQSQKSYKNTDEIVQNKGHYHLSGNDGYGEEISPNIPRENIKNLENDSEYKLNFFTNHNQRLQRGYAALAPWLLDEWENMTKRDKNYTAQEWLQAVYDADMGFYKNLYYTYLESKDFLNKLRHYNQAIRANFDYYKRKNAYEYSTKEIIVTPDTQPSIDSIQGDVAGEIDNEPSFDKPFESTLNNHISMLLQQEAHTTDHDVLDSYYNTESAIFLMRKKAFLESQKALSDDIILLVREKSREYYLGEYKGQFYGVQDTTLIETYYSASVFLNYAEEKGGIKGDGAYCTFKEKQYINILIYTRISGENTETPMYATLECYDEIKRKIFTYPTLKEHERPSYTYAQLEAQLNFNESAILQGVFIDNKDKITLKSNDEIYKATPRDRDDPDQSRANRIGFYYILLDSLQNDINVFIDKEVVDIIEKLAILSAESHNNRTDTQ